MRILLITSSARGHALADTLKQSPQNPTLISIATTANPGIRELSEAQFVESNLTKIDQILSIAKKTKPDLAVIGPEDPIAAGIADALEEQDIPTVAPKKNLARIESSKGFARELLKKHNIDCSPKFKVFSSEPLSLTLPRRGRERQDSLSHGERVRERGSKKEIRHFIEDDLQGNYVVKYDALKGGKGVKVSGEHLKTTDDGVRYAELCIAECGQVVIEEKLIGCEFSLISFVDGTHVVDCPLVQDHKRAFNGDTGPNTGGMGTYSDADHSLPFLKTADVERAKEIQRLTVDALKKECGESYKGFLYGGYMATRDGIKVIEFNCRFGDPEALNILSILESDFVAICQAMTTGELKEDMVRFAKKATVCKYIVPKSYPEGKEEVGEKFRLPDVSSRAESRDGISARIYLGDVSLFDSAQSDTFILGGSRSAGIVGIGNTITDAEYIAQSICEKIKGPVRWRSDIGTPHLIQERTQLMNRLRS